MNTKSGIRHSWKYWLPWHNNRYYTKKLEYPLNTNIALRLIEQYKFRGLEMTCTVLQDPVLLKNRLSENRTYSFGTPIMEYLFLKWNSCIIMKQVS